MTKKLDANFVFVVKQRLVSSIFFTFMCIHEYNDTNIRNVAIMIKEEDHGKRVNDGTQRGAQ